MKYCNFLLILSSLSSILWFKIGIVEGIIGGNKVTSDEYQYTVSIQVDNEHVCGGGIIGEEHVITVAHCIIDEKDNFRNVLFTVLPGIKNLKDHSRQHIEVEIIYIPKEYRHFDMTNIVTGPIGDIAILKLKDKLIFSPTTGLKQLQLPRRILRGGHFSQYSGEKASITGFGDNHALRGVKRNRESEVQNTAFLKIVETNVLHQRSCRSLLRPFTISNEHLCAIVPIDTPSISGACFGDDGGPLVHDEVTIIGVLSKYRNDCDQRIETALYSRITYFMPFINAALNGKDLINTRVAAYRDKNLDLKLGIESTSTKAMNLVEVTKFLNK